MGALPFRPSRAGENLGVLGQDSRFSRILRILSSHV